MPGGVVSALAVLAAYARRGAAGPDVEDARTVALVVLVLTGLYLVLLLEDEAMRQSKVRARLGAGPDGRRCWPGSWARS